MKQGLRLSTVVLLAGCLLAGCSIGRPQMPSRDTVIPGQSITVEGNKNVYAVAREHNV